MRVAFDVGGGLDAAFAELRDRMGGLPNPVEAQGIWTTIWYEEAHHSTALEGSTLVLEQVEWFVADGVAIGNSELEEYVEVQGYGTAAKWVDGHALEPGAWSDGDLVTITEVRQVHATALGPVQRRR